jgi:UDPglucose--hexose-1-phosphate uridylyltransferase
VHVGSYVKPDGRKLWLYSRVPMVPVVATTVPSPSAVPVVAASHMRRHPLTQEWVIYAAHRQDRTFLPSAAANPLAPTVDSERPTELPMGDYDVAVFENRFPTLARHAEPAPGVPGIETAPATGICEVVVFSQDPATSLATLPVDHVALILDVFAARTDAMRAQGVKYVLPFENRGQEMGVTLHHPHGQIYGYDFIPRVQANALENLRVHHRSHGKDMVSTLAADERARGVRVVTSRSIITAFTPPFARFPYEVWIAPARPAPFLSSLTVEERREMAECLREILQRMDGLWKMQMPYLMTINQAPTDGFDYPEWTVRIEIWPIRRAPNKLKFLAGTELGAGVFASDVLPEAAATALRAVSV